MKILICGDRDYSDKDKICNAVMGIMVDYHIDCIIEGEARGADRLGRQVAEELKIKVLSFPADWNKYGNAAGPIRNRQMLKEGKPDLILAFHSNLEKSKGTKDMIFAANKAGVKVILDN